MRTTQVFRLALCVVLVFAASVACVGMEDVWEKPVTVAITDMDVREAVATLLKDTGLGFAIAPNVVGKIDALTFRDVPLRQALDSLAKSEDLVYSVENNVVTIRRRPDYDVWEKQVSLEIKGTEDHPLALREALTALFKDTGLYVVSSPYGTVRPVTLRDVPLRQAMEAVMQAADAVYSVDGNRVSVRRRRTGEKPGLEASRKPGHDPWEKWNELVSLEVKDMPLADAIETLLKGSGINYAIDPSINDLKVTAVLKNVPRLSALTHTVGAAGAELHRQEPNVVSIRRGSADPPGMAGPLVGVPPGSVPALPDTSKTAVVQLKYLNPGEIAPLLVKPGWLEVQSVSGGKLVLRGSEEALQEAKTLIEALDDESALPRPVRIQISAEATITPKGKKPIEVTSTQTIVAAEGQNPEMTIIGNSRVESLAMDFNAGHTLILSVTPWVGRDGRISLSGSLMYRYLFESKLHIGLHALYDTPDTTTFAVSLEPGKPQVIASDGPRPSNGVAEAVLVITASATVEEGRLRVPPGGWQPDSAPRDTGPTGGYGGYGGYGGGSGSRRW